MTIGGWARDPSTGKLPATLLIAADGVVLEQIPISQDRGSTEPLWSYRFSAFRLPPGAKALDAYAVLDGRRIVKLEGTRPLGQLPKL